MPSAPSCIDNSWSSIIYTWWSNRHVGLGWHAPMVVPFCCWQCGVYMLAGPFSGLWLVIVQCICQQLRTILYGDIKQWQLCEIQFAWSLNPVWHNRQGMHVLKPTEIKELSRILWRENCSGPRLQPHRRNTPSAIVPLLTARSVGSIYLFAQFPTPARVLLSRGLSGGSSKPPTHCSRQPLKPPLINCN